MGDAPTHVICGRRVKKGRTVKRLILQTNNNNNNDRLTAFDPGQPG